MLQFRATTGYLSSDLRRNILTKISPVCTRSYLLIIVLSKLWTHAEYDQYTRYSAKHHISDQLIMANTMLSNYHGATQLSPKQAMAITQTTINYTPRPRKNVTKYKTVRDRVFHFYMFFYKTDLTLCCQVTNCFDLDDNVMPSMLYVSSCTKRASRHVIRRLSPKKKKPLKFKRIEMETEQFYCLQ